MSGDNRVSRTRFRKRSLRGSRRIRLIGNGIFYLASRAHRRLKQSLSRPECTYGADILQRERKRNAALNAGSDIELVQLQAQTETICIIANLRGGPLENRMQHIV